MDANLTSKILVCVSILLVSGCSTVKPIKSISTYDQINVFFSGSIDNDESFILEHDSGTIRADRTQNISDGKFIAEFSLPTSKRSKISTCFKLIKINHGITFDWLRVNGSSFNMGGDSNVLINCIRNPMFSKYLELEETKKLYLDEIKRIKLKLPKNINNISRKLNRHPAFIENSCKLIPMESIPARPTTICDDPDRLDEARISCLAPLGSMACKFAVDKAREEQGKKSTGIERFVAGNTCSMLLKKKLNFDDVALSAIEAGADSMIDSDMGLLDIFGYVLKGAATLTRITSAESCWNGIFPQCEKKINDWENEVHSIKSKPEVLKNQCVNLLSNYRKLMRKNESLHMKIREVDSKLKKLLASISEVKNKPVLKVY